jgi:DNA polymerase-3 subunit delta'
MMRIQRTKKDMGTASSRAGRTAAAAPGRGFDEVLGNGRIKKILRLALEKGRVPNSLIFSGPEGVGKRRLALLLAQALNCERGKIEPCGECTTCRKILDGKLPEVVKVRPGKLSIGIDEMKEVRQAAYVKPMSARLRRVFIVSEADKMTPDAANCLLKILEEPPPYSYIILVTAMPHLILPTIKSRCQVLDFSPIGREEIKRALVEKGHPEDRAGVMALLVNGNLEEAMKLDWDKVQERRREAWDVFAALQGGGEGSVFLRSYAFSKRDLVRDDFERLLGILASFCRDTSLLKMGGKASLLLNPDYAEKLRALETGWRSEDYTKCLNKIEQTFAGLKKSLNMGLLVMSFYSLPGEMNHG